MTTKEAIQAMLDGKKIQLPRWGSSYYLTFSEKGRVIDETGTPHSIPIAEYWEIYEEPKPKQTVTIEKWLMKTQHANETHFILEASREAIELHEKGVYEAKPLKLLDTYEVEL